MRTSEFIQYQIRMPASWGFHSCHFIKAPIYLHSAILWKKSDMKAG